MEDAHRPKVAVETNKVLDKKAGARRERAYDVYFALGAFAIGFTAVKLFLNHRQMN